MQLLKNVDQPPWPFLDQIARAFQSVRWRIGRSFSQARPELISDLVPPFQSVALVGNAPRLAAREDGAAIDAHEVVIRINDGPSEGYERHAGRRTTLRFVGIPIKARHAAFFAQLTEASTIVTREENRRILRSLNWSGGAVYLDHYGQLVRSTFPRLSDVVDIGEIPKRNPRTGIVVLGMLADAMKSGKKVSLFGFETERKEEGPEHFYEDGRLIAKNLRDHDQYHCPVELEFELLKKLELRGLIAIH